MVKGENDRQKVDLTWFCVVLETMRKYPPLPLLNRICVKDYKLPDSDLFVEKGTRLVVPVLGLHHDPDYFPEPATFNPDRFNEANKNRIPTCAYIPFGEGPRICIGEFCTKRFN